MTIGEFSGACGLSPKVLRAYADQGVLVPSAVDRASGYRYYDARQLEEAAIVVLLRRVGVPVADIGRFLDGPSADALDGWERSLGDEIRFRREALAEVRGRLGMARARTRGVTMVGVRPVADRAELARTFDLTGGELAKPLDASDRRFEDLDGRFPQDRPLMVVAETEERAVGGALAFRN